MNKDRFGGQNKRDRNKWGGFNRGGFGRGRGSSGNRGFRGGIGKRNDYGGKSNQQWQNRPKRETPGKRLCEADIGVTEYLTDHEGFNGIIKSRYSDFQVAEVNEKGEVAMLTDLSPPQAPVEEVVDEDEDLLLSKYNLEILPMETWDRINSLAIRPVMSGEKVEIDVSDVAKEQRTKIHDAVKKAFGESIVSSTVNIDDKKLMRFEKYRKGVRIDNRVKWVWPEEYVHFIVHKENCDTMDAAVRIAERIRIHVKPSMLGYAGTKDRRAKTSQWFSLRKVDPRRIASSCRDMRDLHVGNFSFSRHNLKLGMLKGNRFRIALRNVEATDDTIDKACQNLRDQGFINYYGLQRFGTRIDMPTYEIGMKLLQGKFKEAIDGILAEREGPMQEALRLYKLEGAAAGAAALPRRTHSQGEARLLRALAAAPGDLLTALNKFPRNIRLLYLHSYQSLVWNRAVSERLRRLGLAPAPGDLVPLAQVQQEELEEESDTEESQNDDDVRDDAKMQDGVETQDGVANQDDVEKQDGDDKKDDGSDEKPSDSQTDGAENQKRDSGGSPKIPVKVLTQKDVDSGKYTIFDIIMPLPGFNVEYPPNIRDYYETLLEKNGLKIDLKHKIKCYSMSGAYRHVAVRPPLVQWSCVRYSDPLADLLPSDLDRVRGRDGTARDPDGRYKALLLTMMLPASCYATMALRELLKVDTSCDNQALQNNYYKRKRDGDTCEEDGGKEDGVRVEADVAVKRLKTEDDK